MAGFLKELFSVYKTPKVVRIKSRFLAITYLAVVITVWVCYLGSYQLDLRKIYQKTCKVSGSVLTKTKGALSTEEVTDEELGVSQPKLYQRVWDNSDLVFQSHGGEAGFVVVTNLLITPNQTLGKCPEVSRDNVTFCQKDADCQKVRGKFLHSGHGILTGNCSSSHGKCEVSAWCPIENDSLPFKGRKALLEATQDFTVMIKNSIEFPDCGPNFKRRNILKNSTQGYLSNCIFDGESDRNCPIFKIGDIVKWSNANFSQVAISGGVFQVEINWNCGFDWGNTIDDCFPKYSFSRIDVAQDETEISQGWNFRAANYEESQRRTLTKYYGLKILISVTGEGKCFDFLTLVLTIGATIGFFSVAPLVCDLLLDIFSKLKKFYPFHICFSNYSAGARVEGHKSNMTANNATGPTNKIEMYNSNGTISETLDSTSQLAQK